MNISENEDILVMFRILAGDSPLNLAELLRSLTAAVRRDVEQLVHAEKEKDLRQQSEVAHRIASHGRFANRDALVEAAQELERYIREGGSSGQKHISKRVVSLAQNLLIDLEAAVDRMSEE